VKLDEFHVGDPGAGPVGHGDAVARSDIGIGRDQINLAAAAGSEDDILGLEGMDAIVMKIQNIGAKTATGLRVFAALQERFHDQIDGDEIFVDMD